MRGVEPHVSREHGASTLLAHVTFTQYVVLLVRHPWIMECALPVPLSVYIAQVVG